MLRPICSTPTNPFRCVCGKRVNSDGIHASGGLLVQILPKAAEEPALVELIEQRCREITDSVSGWQTVATSLKICSGTSSPTSIRNRSTTPKPVRACFFCPCSRERSKGALLLLGRDELTDMRDKDGGADDLPLLQQPL